MVKWKPENKDEEEAYTTFLKSEKINKYLERYKNQTRNNYNTWLRKFFIWKKVDPDTYIKDPRKLSRRKEIEYKDQLEDDINDFITFQLKSNVVKAGKNFSIMKASIKGFYESNRIDFSNAFWNSVKRRLPKTKAITRKETPTKEQLKKIFNHLDTVGKALFFVQMTSGSRIDEICKLKLNDIQLEYDYPRIFITYDISKNTKSAIKRITPEAKEYLITYLEMRNDYIRTKIRKSGRCLNPDGTENMEETKKAIKLEERLFPMNEQNAILKWDNALKKANLFEEDPVTHRVTMGTHSMRRYFYTQFKREHNKDWALAFMNKGNESENVYESSSQEELDEEYSKGIRNLIIYRTPTDTDSRIRELRENMELLEKHLGLRIKKDHDGVYLVDKYGGITLSTTNKDPSKIKGYEYKFTK